MEAAFTGSGQRGISIKLFILITYVGGRSHSLKGYYVSSLNVEEIWTIRREISGDLKFGEINPILF